MAMRRCARVLAPVVLHAPRLSQAPPSLNSNNMRFLSSTASEVAKGKGKFFGKDFVQVMGTVMIVNAGVGVFVMYNLKDNNSRLSNVGREIKKIDATLEEMEKLLKELKKLTVEMKKLVNELSSLEEK